MVESNRPERDESPAELDREIEISDSPDPQGAGDGSAEAEEEGGYRGMVVPLVVVPAMIVMVAVLIAVLFGMLSGSVKSPEDNLDRLLNGGSNERTQAAFELVRQMLEFETAKGEGRTPEWGIDATFLEDLRTAREGVAEPHEEGDVWVPFVLSSLMAQLGDADGVRQLIEITKLPLKLDPDFHFGQNALFILGSIGRDLDGGLRREVAQRAIELTEGTDDGVVLLAAATLQNLPSAGTVEALQGLLGAHRLDMRLQAALSLVELGDDSGREVLLEALDLEPYVKERAADPHRWAPQAVSITRRKALAALVELGELPDPARVQSLLEDEDPNLRSDALELQGGGE